MVFTMDGPTPQELLQQSVVPALLWLLVWGVLALLVARSSNRKLLMIASLLGFALTLVSSALLLVAGGALLLLLGCWVALGPLMVALSASRRGRCLRDQNWL
jgi:CHASE2 domain-containing sensor protein